MQVNILERALTARRASRRIEFQERFDVASPRDWDELVKDISAMANSGGGVILFSGDAPLDSAIIADQLHRYTDSHFANFEIQVATKEGKPVVALIIGESISPIVFTSPGTSFAKGSVYFRHGAKSEPATTEDLAAAIDRRMTMVRKTWLSAVRHVVQPATIAAPPQLPPEIRDSDAPDAVPVRVVDDPRAPAYRVIDYDRTHPFRQKEVLVALRERISGLRINQFDLLAVRKAHGIDSKPEFVHKPAFGSNQYSERFLDWLQRRIESDPYFVEEARARYIRERRASGSR
jgi:hypothetical protein